MAHFAPPSGNTRDNEAKAMGTTGVNELPPDTYIVGQKATVQSLQFVPFDSAGADTGIITGQSVASSLGVEMPHVEELATTAKLSSAALNYVIAVQKRVIVASADALLGTF